MAKVKLFGANVTPACEYCSQGSLAKDEKMILCIYAGIVFPHYSCKKFSYDPLKRIPKCSPKLPTFSKEEFEI